MHNHNSETYLNMIVKECNDLGSLINDLFTKMITNGIDDNLLYAFGELDKIFDLEIDILKKECYNLYDMIIKERDKNA